jgi:hypothetical protein
LLCENGHPLGQFPLIEEAQRVAALLNERDALRAALQWIRAAACGEAQVAEDDEQALTLIWRKANAALEQPAAQSSERGEG